MKKLLIFVFGITFICFASCGTKTQSSEIEQDTVQVDTTQLDA